MHFLHHKVKILLHLMVGHEDWYQYKWILPQIKEAKRVVQNALKPGGGGIGSSGIGECVFKSVRYCNLKSSLDHEKHFFAMNDMDTICSASF